MRLKIIAASLLCLAGLSLSYAEEGRERGRDRGPDNARNARDGGGMRNMRGGMGGLMGGGNGGDTFTRLSSSDKPEDLEQAALSAIKDDLKLQLEDIRTAIISKDSTVSDAYAAAMKAFNDYLAAFDTIPELKTIKQERDEINKVMRSGDWSAMRENFQRIQELTKKYQAVVKDNAEIAKLKEQRIAAASAFTKALAAALEADADFQMLNKKMDTINNIQQLLREEQMANRMPRGRNRGNDNTKEEERQREAKKPSQDVGDF